MRFRFFPILLIALGAGLLLSKLGVLHGEEIHLLLQTWWPALLVALGAALLLFTREGCGPWRERHACASRHDCEKRVESS